MPRRNVGTVWRTLICALGLFALVATAFAQAAKPLVYVAPIEGVIDLGLAPFVKRVLDEAASTGAAAVVLEINTLGGRVDAAILIRDTLLSAPVQTIAFVNKRAISAGALIGLAAHKLIMAEGGTIGAATPVQIGQPGKGAQPVEEKTVSYLRKEFRATAESRKRPPLLAEAMVDADVAIPNVIEKGKLLTLTTEEALKHKLIDFRADSVDNMLERLGIRGAELRRAAPNWAENLVRMLTHPIVSSLLITIGMLGILIELRTPGFGAPGALGIAGLALFFWGHWLVQLAGWEQLLLFGAGLLLLAIEIFVTPGFGVVGALGIAAILGGLISSMVGAGVTWTFVMQAVGRVTLSLFIALVASLILMRFLPRLPFGRPLVLETALPADRGYASAPDTDRRWLGKRGVAHSTLRPAGIAEFEGERVDVVSDGELIDTGEPIEVTRVDGNRIVVRRSPHNQQKKE